VRMDQGVRHRNVTIGYYVLLVSLMTVCLFKLAPHVLPDRRAHWISDQSEGYTAALVLSLWVQFALPRLAGSRREWFWTLAAAAASLAIATYLYNSELVSQVKTLNESFFALALMIPYVTLPRPLPRQAPWLLSAATVAVMCFASWSPLITNLAETWGLLLLIPIGLDVVDRGILDPTAPNRPGLRYGWYVFLLLGPLILHVLQFDLGLRGWVYGATSYAIRFYEAWIFMLFFQLYFAVGLGRTGTSRVSVTTPEPAQRV
jgi:hypothetical protein